MLCATQNRLNEIFLKIVDDKSENIKKIRNHNNFCHYLFLTLISMMCSFNVLNNKEIKWTTIDFIKNLSFLAFHLLTTYMKFSPILLFLAFVNIFKSFYSNVNKKLQNKTGLKIILLRETRKIENSLKEVLDDLNEIFSFVLLGCYVIIFGVLVSGIVISITEKTVLKPDFVLWSLLICISAIVPIIYVYLLTSEVINLHFSLLTIN